jgi:hypothetical protein
MGTEQPTRSVNRVFTAAQERSRVSLLWLRTDRDAESERRFAIQSAHLERVRARIEIPGENSRRPRISAAGKNRKRVCLTDKRRQVT